MTIDELRARMAKRPPISMEDLYAFRAWAEEHGILDDRAEEARGVRDE